MSKNSKAFKAAAEKVDRTKLYSPLEAMALAKELTNHSLPEIGDAFGGRDHTTVLHACRKIASLREESHDIKEDYSNLIRTLSS